MHWIDGRHAVAAMRRAFCGLSAAALVLAGGYASALAAEQGEVRRVSATAAPYTEAFAEVADGDVVSLDLRMAPSPEMLSQFSAGSLDEVEIPRALEGECPFGPLEPLRERLGIPTGDNHFLLSAVLGDSERHAANLASCEYRVGPEGPSAEFRLRGCFLALEVAIPTARQVLLRPMPASACR